MAILNGSEEFVVAQHALNTAADICAVDFQADQALACDGCALVGMCTAIGYGEPGFQNVEKLIDEAGPYRAGETIFRLDEPFEYLYAVKSGMIKAVHLDAEGREQVRGFFLPGELIGFEAISPGKYLCDGVVLDDTRVCRLPFARLSAVAAQQSQVQQHLFKLLSRAISDQAERNWDLSADQRLAAFLLDLSRRYAARGFSPTRFRLCMSRGDIANYLRLAAETVSRVLARLRSQGILDVHGRDAELLKPEALQSLLGTTSLPS